MISMRPKTPTETYVVPFDFIGLLPPGELLADATAIAVVESGIDPSPDVLSSTFEVSGTVAEIQVQNGLPGVIYRLTVTGEDDLGNRYTLMGLLAVL